MQGLKDKRILLAMSGGIAAYKVAELTRLLTQEGATVQVIMSEAATQFITPVTMQALSGNPVFTDAWDKRVHNNMAHIELSRQADVIVLAPASADCLGKIALGLANDLVTTSILARNCPLIVVPAMNKQMWENPATQRTMKQLAADQIEILGPTSGSQACGEEGLGRMLEAKEIAQGVVAFFQPKVLQGKHILVTAGPTYEAIDPVRGITNKSSGKMGFAVAQAAVEMGAQVTLIAGPCHLNTPLEMSGRIHRIDVTSAQDMHLAVMKNLACDAFFAVAAVADWTISNASAEKIKKSAGAPEIDLVINPDVLAEVARHAHEHGRPYCVGFAAETNNLDEFAKEKRLKKGIPLLVANIGPQTFGMDTNELLLVEENTTTRFTRASKIELARQLLTFIAKKI